MIECKLKKRIIEKMIHEENLIVCGKIRMNKSTLWGVLDEAFAGIFPLPTGELPINPKTGQRDIIVLELKDWLPHINKLKEWLEEVKP
jgi:hypothetical protein